MAIVLPPDFYDIIAQIICRNRRPRYCHSVGRPCQQAPWELFANSMQQQPQVSPCMATTCPKGTSYPEHFHLLFLEILLKHRKAAFDPKSYTSSHKLLQKPLSSPPYPNAEQSAGPSPLHVRRKEHAQHIGPSSRAPDIKSERRGERCDVTLLLQSARGSKKHPKHTLQFSGILWQRFMTRFWQASFSRLRAVKSPRFVSVPFTDHFQVCATQWGQFFLTHETGNP